MSDQWERPLDEDRELPILPEGNSFEAAMAGSASEEHSEDDAGSFGPEAGFESESSVSDKAFLHEESVNPVAARDDAEFGGELATAPGAAMSSDAGGDRRNIGWTIGFAGIIMAVLSFFVFSGILGPAAIVIGFMAYAAGSKSVGVWSMLLGAISFTMFLLSLQPAPVY